MHSHPTHPDGDRILARLARHTTVVRALDHAVDGVMASLLDLTEVSRRLHGHEEARFDATRVNCGVFARAIDQAVGRINALLSQLQPHPDDFDPDEVRSVWTRGGPNAWKVLE